MIHVKIFLLFLLGAMTRSAMAFEQKEQPPAAYCGVLSLYAGMNAIGSPITPQQLVKPEYLSTVEGSSIAELIQAAEDHGVRAKAFDHLNVSGLCFLTNPALLHVRRSALSRQPDHWVLYLGESGGIARIVDPASGQQKTLLTDLARRWDGLGIALGVKGNSWFRPEQVAGLFQWAAYGLALLSAIYFLNALTERFTHTHHVSSGSEIARQGIVVVPLIIATAIAGALVSPLSLFHQSEAAQVVRDEAIASFLPKVNLDDLSRLLTQPGVHLVDARTSGDADLGMIPGAVNIFADTDSQELLRRVKDWQRTSPVLVYCRNQACPFSARLATKLQVAGFLDIRIFAGGWQEWTDNQTQRSSGKFSPSSQTQKGEGH